MSRPTPNIPEDQQRLADLLKVMRVRRPDARPDHAPNPLWELVRETTAAMSRQGHYPELRMYAALYGMHPQLDLERVEFTFGESLLAAIKAGSLDLESVAKYVWFAQALTDRPWSEETLADLCFALIGFEHLIDQIERRWLEATATLVAPPPTPEVPHVPTPTKAADEPRTAPSSDRSAKATPPQPPDGRAADRGAPVGAPPAPGGVGAAVSAAQRPTGSGGAR